GPEEVTGSGLPPSGETIKILPRFPGNHPRKAILRPSGDQRGESTCKGENVSWRRSLPLLRARHRELSGYETYVTHSPLRVKSRCSADSPSRNGTNSFRCAS